MNEFIVLVNKNALTCLLQTAYIPEKERYHVTKAQLLAMMDTMMGGRAAEELIFGPDKITSGASSDLQVNIFSLPIFMLKKFIQHSY